MKRRHLLQGAAALALAAPLGLRAQDAGPGAFDTLDLDWADGARQRPVPVRLYRPQAMAEGARVPLIVFSHGIGGSRRGYTWLGRFVAAHGIASLHLQHVGSDRTLWSGGLFSLVGRLQDAAQADEALARVMISASRWTRCWPASGAAASTASASWPPATATVPTPACWWPAPACRRPRRPRRWPTRACAPPSS